LSESPTIQTELEKQCRSYLFSAVRAIGQFWSRVGALFVHP